MSTSSVLNTLNSQLSSVLDVLRSKDVSLELQKGLHNHEKGALPDAELSSLASRTIDLLHSVEQMLEPGYLVLADHYLGTHP
jgi:hypothetical protein